MAESAELEARVAALTSAPLGCAFLGRDELARLSPAATADPATSFELLGRASCEVSVWQHNHTAILQEHLAQGPRLRPLARAILAQPATAGWFGPLDRDARLVAGGRFWAAPAPPPLPAEPPTKMERYVQQPSWALYTSTAFGGISAYLIGAARTFGELGPLPLPLPRFRLVPASGARIYEVDSPQAWRRLCVRYPAPEPGGFHDSLLVPDFGQVLRDWDAVHVSFGGLLATDQVRLTGPEGPTELQGWDCEQTVWLRWVFEKGIRLPDLEEYPASPLP